MDADNYSMTNTQFDTSVFPGAQKCAFWRNFGLTVPENIPRRAMRGAIFVGSKRPGIFSPVFSSLFPVLVTPIGRLFFLLVSVLNLIQSVLLTF